MKFQTPDDKNEYFEERASIPEYDGGFSRIDAERLAGEDLRTALERDKIFRLEVQDDEVSEKPDK